MFQLDSSGITEFVPGLIMTDPSGLTSFGEKRKVIPYERSVAQTEQ